MKRFINSFFSKPNEISSGLMLLLSILIVILLTPILARNCPNGIIIGLMVLVIASLCPILAVLERRSKRALFVLAVYMAVITVYKLIGKSTAELYYYFNMVQFYFFFGAGCAILPNLKHAQKKILLAVICGAVLITVVHNVYLFFDYGGKEYVMLFRVDKYTTNSINTPYVTAIMLLSGLAFVVGLDKKHTFWSRFVFCAIAFLGLMFITLIVQRMIVLLLSLLLAGLLVISQSNIFKKEKASRRTGLLWSAGIMAVFILLWIYAVPILELVKRVIFSSRLDKRIDQIIRLIQTGDIRTAGGSLTVRYELIVTSLRTFTRSLSNALLGAGDHRITNAIIGNHSYLFDELARYGILLAPISYLLFYQALCSVYRGAELSQGTVLSRQLRCVLIVVVLRAVVGAIYDASIGIVLFLAVPLLFNVIQDKQET